MLDKRLNKIEAVTQIEMKKKKIRPIANKSAAAVAVESLFDMKC